MKKPLSNLAKMRLAAIPLTVAVIACLFVPPIYAPLILALPAGVWCYFADKRYSCPRCHKHYGRMIRHLSHCPHCGLELHDETSE